MMLRPCLPRRGSERLAERVAKTLDPITAILFDDPAIGAMFVDPDGRLLKANRRLLEMLDGAVVKAGEPIAELFEAREQIAAALEMCLTGGHPSAEFYARCRTGGAAGELVVAVSIVPVPEVDHAISGLLLRLTDVTPERLLTTQLEQSQKLQAVGQMAGGIAHDFNNLLTAIIGAADCVLERDTTEGETLADVRQIRAGAERGAALVRQLLAFGRRQPLRPKVIQLNVSVQEVAALLRPVLGEKLHLELVLEEPGRTVRVDPVQLDQVLINLAMNARDAMAERGRLIVRTGHRTLYRAEVRGTETILPGRYVVVEVSDNGVGIAPDVLPRVFEPFFTTHRERGGSGLGLSTVHGFVRQSGGFVTIDSCVGQGTMVRLYLPRHDDLAEVKPIESQRTALPEGRPAPTMTSVGDGLIVLVEDEDPVRRLAERALRKAGRRVMSFASAETALEGIASASPQERPSLLVSDVVMPGMDGRALVAAMRAIWPGLPAVLMSGYAESALTGDLQGNGVVFLAKPYTLSQLLATVARCAEGARGGPTDMTGGGP